MRPFHCARMVASSTRHRIAVLLRYDGVCGSDADGTVLLVLNSEREPTLLPSSVSAGRSSIRTGHASEEEVGRRLHLPVLVGDSDTDGYSDGDETSPDATVVGIASLGHAPTNRVRPPVAAAFVRQVVIPTRDVLALPCLRIELAANDLNVSEDAVAAAAFSPVACFTPGDTALLALCEVSCSPSSSSASNSVRTSRWVVQIESTHGAIVVEPLVLPSGKLLLTDDGNTMATATALSTMFLHLAATSSELFTVDRIQQMVSWQRSGRATFSPLNSATPGLTSHAWRRHRVFGVISAAAKVVALSCDAAHMRLYTAHSDGIVRVFGIEPGRFETAVLCQVDVLPGSVPATLRTVDDGVAVRNAVASLNTSPPLAGSVTGSVLALFVASSLPAPLACIALVSTTALSLLHPETWSVRHVERFPEVCTDADVCVTSVPTDSSHHTSFLCFAGYFAFSQTLSLRRLPLVDVLNGVVTVGVGYGQHSSSAPGTSTLVDLVGRWRTSPLCLPGRLGLPLRLPTASKDPTAQPVLFRRVGSSGVRSSGYTAQPWSVKQKAKQLHTKQLPRKVSPSSCAAGRPSHTDGTEGRLGRWRFPLGEGRSLAVDSGTASWSSSRPVHGSAVTELAVDAGGVLMSSSLDGLVTVARLGGSNDTPVALPTSVVRLTATQSGSAIAAAGGGVVSADLASQGTSSLVATVGQDGVVRIFHPSKRATPHVSWEFSPPGRGQATTVRFFNRGSLLLAGGTGGVVHPLRFALDYGQTELDRRKNDSCVESAWGRPAAPQAPDAAQTVVALDAFNRFPSPIICFAASNKSVSVYDIEKAASVSCIRDAHTRTITQLSMFKGSDAADLRADAPPQYHLLVTAGLDNQIKLWDMRTMGSAGAVRTFVGHSNLASRLGLAVSPCGQYVFSGSEDRAVIAYDVGMGAVLHRTACADVPTAIACHPRGVALWCGLMSGALVMFPVM